MMCQTPVETYYRRLAGMGDIEYISGNTTHCQYISVLKKATYEKRKKLQLHNDPVFELRQQRQDLIAAMRCRLIHGYIQTIGLTPFSALLFTEKQIELNVKACKDPQPCTVHFDSTGSVVTRIEGEKIPMYYCLLMEDGSLPVMEMLCTCHTAAFVCAQLEMFQHYVRLMNNGKAVFPQCVVTDYSFAPIHACMLALGNGSLIEYFQKCAKILNGDADEEDIMLSTVLVVCYAHVMKNMAVRLKAKESDKNKRKATMSMFAVLAQCSTIREGKHIYSLINKVLTWRHECEVVVEARRQILSAATELNESTISCQESDDQ
jgi:hypothetical protein